MKKLISVLLCFVLLFSLCAFAAAEDVPQLAVVAYRDNTAWVGADVAEDYVCFDVSVNKCTELECFELLITYNAAVVEYSEHYPFLLDDEVRNSIDCTVTETGKLRVIGTNDGYGADFEPFCFKVIGEGDTDVSVKLVSFKGTDGEIENVVFETSIENFTAGNESAVLQLINHHASSDGTEYSCFNFAAKNCGELESFELIVHYNPAVLEYSSVYPFLQIAVKLNSIDCTLIQPGQMRVIGTNDSDWLQNYKDLHMSFEPFCFKVIGEGDTDISVELVSFRTADGEVENVVLDADIQNFTVEEAPQLKVSTRKVLGDDWEEHYCFSLGVKNCMEFESLELLITYNPDVLEYSKVFPYAMPDEYRHLISCTVEDAGKLRVTAYCWDLLMHGHIEKIEPFCFNFIGTGDTDVAVELVSFKTADGEIENINFDTNIQNFTVTDFFVKYDLTGDSVVAAEDARLALRFAVGLDSATQSQCRAAGIASAKDFTAEIARVILRRSVGLDA